MQISLLYVGRAKEQFIELGERVYVKKLAPFCKLDFIEVKSFGHLKGQSKQAIIDKEGVEKGDESQSVVEVHVDELGENVESIGIG